MEEKDGQTARPTPTPIPGHPLPTVRPSPWAPEPGTMGEQRHRVGRAVPARETVCSCAPFTTADASCSNEEAGKHLCFGNGVRITHH